MSVPISREVGGMEVAAVVNAQDGGCLKERSE